VSPRTYALLLVSYATARYPISRMRILADRVFEMQMRRLTTRSGGEETEDFGVWDLLRLPSRTCPTKTGSNVRPSVAVSPSCRSYRRREVLANPELDTFCVLCRHTLNPLQAAACFEPWRYNAPCYIAWEEPWSSRWQSAPRDPRRHACRPQGLRLCATFQVEKR
jgi:hypothetical protein